MVSSYYFVCDDAVLIITDERKRNAERDLPKLVKNPDEWSFDRAERLA